MKLYDPKWTLYVMQSLAIFFQTNTTVSLFVEGAERNTDGLPEYLELRVDGPNIFEYTKNNWKLYFEVNMLLCVIMQPSAALFRDKELAGEIAGLFIDSIPVFEYDANGVKGAAIGCLTLEKGRKEKVQISHFGKIRPDTPMLQSTVEAHYNLHMDN